MRVAIAGASGLIGRRLVKELCARGDDVIALSRRRDPIGPAATTRWDPTTEALPIAATDGVDAIVNLAGESVAGGRWGAAHRRRILESRVQTTKRIVAAMRRPDAPPVLVNGSAVGYYGPTEKCVDEQSPPGDDFLASVCVAWEAEAVRGAQSGARVVLLRTGIVLSRDGGALPKLLLPARLGAGGPLAGGRQWQSWIHIDDEVGLILHALDEPQIIGAVNLTAPKPVRQRDFAKALGRALHRPAFLPTPRLALRLLLGGAAEIATVGQCVTPTVALQTGYAFAFSDVEAALADLLT